MSNGRRNAEGVLVENAPVVTHEITHHPDQVAGHGDLLKDSTLGAVYKPIIPVEHFFYGSTKEHPEFLPFIPKYNGVVTIHKDNTPFQFISLEDISHSYIKPNIMDIKMGITQHLEGMSDEKKALAVAKCKNSTSFAMGFRICGIKVYNRESKEYVSWDRFWGRNVPPSEIVHAVSKFFRYPQYKDFLIDSYNGELSKLLPIMKTQTSFRFVSSSLLFVYEGDCSSTDSLRPQVKMIDFANTLPLSNAGRNEIDDGYSMGLANIIDVFNKIKELDSHN